MKSRTTRTWGLLFMAAVAMLALGRVTAHAEAWDELPHHKSYFTTPYFPKNGQGDYVSSGYTPGDVRNVMENFYEGYWRETSYYRANPTNGLPVRGYYMDSKTAGEIAMPWAWSAGLIDGAEERINGATQAVVAVEGVTNVYAGVLDPVPMKGRPLTFQIGSLYLTDARGSGQLSGDGEGWVNHGTGAYQFRLTFAAVPGTELLASYSYFVRGAAADPGAWANFSAVIGDPADNRFPDGRGEHFVEIDAEDGPVVLYPRTDPSTGEAVSEPLIDGFWTPGERFTDNPGQGNRTAPNGAWDPYIHAEDRWTPVHTNGGLYTNDYFKQRRDLVEGVGDAFFDYDFSVTALSTNLAEDVAPGAVYQVTDWVGVMARTNVEIWVADTVLNQNLSFQISEFDLTPPLSVGGTETLSISNVPNEDYWVPNRTNTLGSFGQTILNNAFVDFLQSADTGDVIVDYNYSINPLSGGTRVVAGEAVAENVTLYVCDMAGGTNRPVSISELDLTPPRFFESNVFYNAYIASYDDFGARTNDADGLLEGDAAHTYVWGGDTSIPVWTNVPAGGRVEYQRLDGGLAAVRTAPHTVRVRQFVPQFVVDALLATPNQTNSFYGMAIISNLTSALRIEVTDMNQARNILGSPAFLGFSSPLPQNRRIPVWVDFPVYYAEPVWGRPQFTSTVDVYTNMIVDGAQIANPFVDATNPSDDQWTSIGSVTNSTVSGRTVRYVPGDPLATNDVPMIMEGDAAWTYERDNEAPPPNLRPLYGDIGFVNRLEYNLNLNANGVYVYRADPSYAAQLSCYVDLEQPVYDAIYNNPGTPVDIYTFTNGEIRVLSPPPDFYENTAARGPVQTNSTLRRVRVLVHVPLIFSVPIWGEPQLGDYQSPPSPEIDNPFADAVGGDDEWTEAVEEEPYSDFISWWDPSGGEYGIGAWVAGLVGTPNSGVLPRGSEPGFDYWSYDRYTNYIANNYPGDVAGLIARCDDEQYDSAEEWADVDNNQIIQSGYLDDVVTSYGNWDFSVGPTSISSYFDWWMDRYGDYGSPGSIFVASVPNVREWNPGQTDLTQTVPSTTVTNTLANGVEEVVTTFGSLTHPPVGSTWTYDSPREFDDLASSMYHNPDLGSRAGLMMRNYAGDINPQAAYDGGDLRLGEETSPWSGSFFGEDRGGNNPQGAAFDGDGILDGAGPFAYNTHANYGRDAANQLNIEFTTHRTDGQYLTGPRGGHRMPLGYDYRVAFYANWTDSVPYARDHRDVSLNGMIDQGETVPAGCYNYFTDADPDTDDDGMSTMALFGWERCVEDMIDILDEVEDFDALTRFEAPPGSGPEEWEIDSPRWYALEFGAQATNTLAAAVGAPVLYSDADGNGVYTPGFDPMWVDEDLDGLYTGMEPLLHGYASDSTELTGVGPLSVRWADMNANGAYDPMVDLVWDDTIVTAPVRYDSEPVLVDATLRLTPGDGNGAARLRTQDIASGDIHSIYVYPAVTNFTLMWAVTNSYDGATEVYGGTTNGIDIIYVASGAVHPVGTTTGVQWSGTSLFPTDYAAGAAPVRYVSRTVSDLGYLGGEDVFIDTNNDGSYTADRVISSPLSQLPLNTDGHLAEATAIQVGYTTTDTNFYRGTSIAWLEEIAPSNERNGEYVIFSASVLQDGTPGIDISTYVQWIDLPGYTNTPPYETPPNGAFDPVELVYAGINGAQDFGDALFYDGDQDGRYDLGATLQIPLYVGGLLNQSGLQSPGVFFAGQRYGTMTRDRYISGFNQNQPVAANMPEPGLMTHEQSHDVLGWPDLYDYDTFGEEYGNGAASGGDLMSDGPMQHGYPDLKWAYGVTPQELNYGSDPILEPNGGPQTLRLYPIERYVDQYYVFRDERNPNEFYTICFNAGNLEGTSNGNNEQPSPYANAIGRGIMITKSDYVVGDPGWPQQQRSNNRFNWLFVQSDGLYELEDGVGSLDTNDVFGMTGTTRQFTEATVPPAVWFDERPSGMRILDMRIPTEPYGPAEIDIEWYSPTNAPTDITQWYWVPSGVDSDEDGIPDVWEYYWFGRYANPLEIAGENTDYDGDGLTDYGEWLAQANPTWQSSWESANDPDPLTDAEYDSDGDGLSNADEVYTYKTLPRDPDTDDDGVDDGDEVNPYVVVEDELITGPRESRSPLVQRSLMLDGTPVPLPDPVLGSADERFDLTMWTIECYYRPDASNQTGTLIQRVTDAGETNFELGLTNGRPYVAFTTDTGTRYMAGANADLIVDEWTHLGGVWDPANDALKLYVDMVAFQSQLSVERCAMGEGEVTIGDGLTGYLDELRFWDIPLEFPIVYTETEVNVGLVDVTLADAQTMWDYLTGGSVPPGVTVQSLTYSGSPEAAAVYTTFPSLGGYSTQPPAGMILSSGEAMIAANDSNTSPGATGAFGLPGDDDLFEIAGEVPTYDAAALTIEFESDATVDGVSFYVLFASEEFPEYVGSFNDAFAAFLDGQNMTFDDNGVALTVNNNFFELDNDPWDPADPDAVGKIPVVLPFEYDGLTPLLVSATGMSPGSHTLKLVVADASDGILDSIAFLSNLKFVAGFGTKRATADGGALAHYRFDDGGDSAQDFTVEEDWMNQWAHAIDGAAMTTNAFVPMYDLPDEDDDGLPDWWELLFFGSEDGADVDADTDDDGLNNLYEFYCGTNPREDDSDNDGLDDPYEDADGDGLLNGDEQAADSDPRVVDTDDDGVSDYEEDQAGYSPVDSLDALVDRALELDGTGYVQVARGEQPLRFMLPSFTIEAWVRLDAGAGEGVVIQRQVGANQNNFLMGISTNGVGEYIPYVRVTPITDASMTGANDAVAIARTGWGLKTEEWYHLAATLDASTKELVLLVNGVRVDTDLVKPVAMTRSTGPDFVRVGQGFDGYIDEVRIWSTAQPDEIVSQEQFNKASPYVERTAVRVRGSDAFARAVVPDPNLVLYYPFDDGGVTVEDHVATVANDWWKHWIHAGVLVGSASMTNSFPGNLPLDEITGDSDGDGLPDGWEIGHFGSILTVDGTGDWDNDGLTDLYEYLAGTNPKLENSDANEVLDRDEDPDGDGLTNLEEQDAGTDPQDVDTDDDTVEDGDELDPSVNGISSPLHGMGAYDPPLRALRLDRVPANGIELPQSAADARQGLLSWTIEAMVLLNPADQTGTLISKRAGPLTAFELGLNVGVPYVRYDTPTGSSVTLAAKQPLENSRRTHLAATYSSAERVLRLYVDAVAMVEIDLNDHDLYDTYDTPVTGYGAMSIGATTNAWQFQSLIDNIRIWNTALSAVELDDGMEAYISAGTDGRLLRDYRFDDSGANVDDFAHLGDEDYVLASADYGISLSGGQATWLANTGVPCTGYDDADGDGLPDWFESVFQIMERTGDGDLDDLSNFYEYLCRTDPTEEDTDGDLVSDGEDYVVISGVTNDLKNLEEQEFGTHPRLDDTDDDGVSDYDEITGAGAWDMAYWPVSDPNVALQNTVAMPQVVRRSLNLNGSGRVVVPRRAKYMLPSWTVDAWIRPAAGMTGRHIIVRRAVQDLGGGAEALNYELGLEWDGSDLQPYARYVTTNGTEFIVGGAAGEGTSGDCSVAVDEWAAVAGTFDEQTGNLMLYINGMPVGSNEVVQTFDYPPMTGPDPDDIEVTLGGGIDNGGVQNGFIGRIDEIRIANGAMGRAGVFANFRAVDATSRGGFQAGANAAPGSGTVTQLGIAKALEHDYAENEILVRFKPGTSAQARDQVHADNNGQIVRVGRLIPIHTVKVTDARSMDLKLAAYRASPNVLYAEPNYRIQLNAVPNDPDFGMLWGMHNTGQFGGTEDADIDAPEAWERTAGNANYIVAVIDSGIDYLHPDLAANMWVNPGETPNNGIDDDGNGYIDDVYGYDFANNDGDPWDDDGHGTHVAGTIGAVGNNGVGVAGVNWHVKLMALKFLDEYGGGWTDDAIDAIEYAVLMGAKISNNSWGGLGYSQALYDAIEAAMAADHLFVAAAGNYGMDNDGVFPSYPASYDLENIISVAATDDRDQLTYFSNYGLESVDLAAPGGSIYSCIPGNSYAFFDGTSMASPHVAGVAALLRGGNLSLGYAATKQIILAGVDKLDALEGRMVSGGRLNAANSVQGSAAGAVAVFRCDDGGSTLEDMTVVNDNLENWRHAGVFDGANVNSNAFARVPGDSDGDGLADWFAAAYNVDAPYGDDDMDTLMNVFEQAAGRNPLQSDSNNDDQTDDQDDSDSDGRINLDEQRIGSDPGLLDTDDDGVSDDDEFLNLTHPALSLYPHQSLALMMDGSPDPVLLPNQPRLALDDDWTIEAWVRPNASEADGFVILRREVGDTGINYELGVTAGMLPYARFVSVQGVERMVTGGTPLVVDRWEHVAVTFDTSTRRLTLYVGGLLEAGVGTSITAPPAEAVGAVRVVMGDDLDGALDELRVWSTVRSQEDLYGSLRHHLSGQEGSLVAYYRFDDGGNPSGTSANAAWDHGQIQDFASGTVHDWRTEWFNAASIVSTGAVSFVTRGDMVLLEADSDADGIADWWEIYFFGNLVTALGTSGQAGILPTDSDGDGLTDLTEYMAGLDPTQSYTYLETIPDGQLDSDFDGLSNLSEQQQVGSDAGAADTDDDGVLDGIEADNLTSPTQPMSAYSSDPGRWGLALPRSLDMGAITESSGIALPAGEKELAFEDMDFSTVVDIMLGVTDEITIERFQFGTNGWTVEMWVYPEADLDGDLFVLEGIDGDDFRLSLVNGAPYGVISNELGIVAEIGGPISGTTGAGPLPTNQWTHLALVWAPEANVMRLYENGVMMFGEGSLATAAYFGESRAYMARGFSDGYLDELRVWDRVRERNEVQDWYYKVYPAPGYVLPEPDGYIPPHTGPFRKDYTIIETDQMQLPLYRDEYEYKQPILAYYRFDDGGATIEDFAHLNDEAYRIVGPVSTNVFYPALSWDDADGDGLPEWWTDMHNLDIFPEQHIGPYHVMTPGMVSDYPVNYSQGWNTPVGTVGSARGLYYQYEMNADDEGVMVYDFNIWLDVNPDYEPGNTNNPPPEGEPDDGLWGAYPGRGIYDMWDVQVWDDDGWFTPTNTYGLVGVYFHDSEENQMYDMGEDIWYDRWNGGGDVTFDLEAIVGISYFRTFTSYSSIGAWASWAIVDPGTTNETLDLNQYITTKSSSVGDDGLYSCFTKYVYLDREPVTAEIDVVTFAVDDSELYINGALYEPATDPEGANLVALLKEGRNQILFLTANSVTYALNEIDIHYTQDYSRNQTGMKFDMRLTVDGYDVIVRGDTTVGDPRSVWHGQAWSEWWFPGMGGHLSDSDNRLVYHQDFGIPRDAEIVEPSGALEGDGLENNYEVLLGTNPRDFDTDNDGVPDGLEDLDGDGLVNVDEQLLGSDPRLADTDDDGIVDGLEVGLGGDPRDALYPHIPRAAEFGGGAGDYVEMPLLPRFAVEDWTIEAWVSPAVGADGGTIVRRQAGIAGDQDTFVLSLTSNLYPQVGFGALSITATASDFQLSASGTNWTHLAATYDAVARELTLYVNGEHAVSTNSLITSMPFGSGPVIQRVGESFEGRIDEFRLWNRVRTAQQIQDGRDLPLSGREAGLASYYRFDDDTSSLGGNGVSAQSGWRRGQVQDFVYAVGVDWKTRWLNGGTLHGNVSMVELSGQVPTSGDGDGDGLPDWWEESQGLDRFDKTGDNGRWGDPDLDGLSNLAELMAGTEPHERDTFGLFNTDKLTDFFRWQPGVFRIFGELFTDFDRVNDYWEEQYGLDPNAYDSHLDSDDDGWSNYAEFMAGTRPDDDTSWPAPAITFDLHYSGSQGGAVTVLAYHERDMDGEPDAVFTVPVGGSYPQVVTVTNAVQGHLHEGPNWFFAMLGGGTAWSTGNAAGVAHEHPYTVDWSQVGPIPITLTDKLPGYVRAAWTQPADVARVKVEIVDFAQVGNPRVFGPRWIEAPRNWIHEEDLRSAVVYGLPSHGAHELRVFREAGLSETLMTTVTFTNIYNAAQSTPVVVRPVGQTLHFARNELRWTMDDDVVRCIVQVATDSAFTSIVLEQPVLNLMRYEDGTIRQQLWELAGDTVLADGSYFWRVRAITPRAVSNWSVPGSFSVNLSDFPSGPYSVSGDIAYFGKVTSGNFVVQAYDSPGFGSLPIAQTTVSNTSNSNDWPRNLIPFRVQGLPSGAYYVRGFLDQDGDKTKDAWETCGFIQSNAYAPQRLDVTMSVDEQVLPVWLTDTDDDSLADDWEYQYTGDLITMGPGPYGGYTDQNPGGLNDYQSYAFTPMNISPYASDTVAGADGIPVWVKVAFGIDPFEYYAFMLTITDVSPDGRPVVRWPAPAGAESGTGVEGAGEASNNGVTLRYTLQYSEDLLQWTDLQSSDVANYDEASGTFELTDTSHTNRVGFYRVRMTWSE